MARQEVNLGTGYDTNDGDKLRDGGGKINENFTEIYRRSTDWVAGVYPQRTAVFNGNVLYFLSSTAVLPFTSSNFATEEAAGFWVKVEGSSFFDTWLVSKAPGNTVIGTLEPGDIVRGFWSGTEFWSDATYNGGDVLTKTNFTIHNIITP